MDKCNFFNQISETPGWKNEPQCGRCGERGLDATSQIRPLLCNVHILCDACAHFQTGTHCALCHVGTTAKINGYNNGFGTNEHHVDVQLFNNSMNNLTISTTTSDNAAFKLPQRLILPHLHQNNCYDENVSKSASFLSSPTSADLKTTSTTSCSPWSPFLPPFPVIGLPSNYNDNINRDLSPSTTSSLKSAHAHHTAGFPLSNNSGLLSKENGCMPFMMTDEGSFLDAFKQQPKFQREAPTSMGLPHQQVYPSVLSNATSSPMNLLMSPPQQHYSTGTNLSYSNMNAISLTTPPVATSAVQSQSHFSNLSPLIANCGVGGGNNGISPQQQQSPLTGTTSGSTIGSLDDTTTGMANAFYGCRPIGNVVTSPVAVRQGPAQYFRCGICGMSPLNNNGYSSQNVLIRSCCLECNYMLCVHCEKSHLHNLTSLNQLMMTSLDMATALDRIIPKVLGPPPAVQNLSSPPSSNTLIQNMGTHSTQAVSSTATPIKNVHTGSSSSSHTGGSNETIESSTKAYGHDAVLMFSQNFDRRRCSIHGCDPLDCFCDSCAQFVCAKCHQGHVLILGTRAALGRCGEFLRSSGFVRQFDAFLVKVDDEARKIEEKSCDVRRDIGARMKELITVVQQREQTLLRNEQTIKNEKLKSLSEQRDIVVKMRREMQRMLENNAELAKLLDSNSSSSTDNSSNANSVTHWCQQIDRNLRALKMALAEPPADDDRLWFVPESAPPHNNNNNNNNGCANSHHGSASSQQLMSSGASVDPGTLCKLLRQFGRVVTGACAQQSKLAGEYVRRAVKSKPVVYNIQTRGFFGELCQFGNDKVNVFIRAPNGTLKEGSVSDRKNGTYQCSVTPDVEGNHQVYICVRNRNIHGSPFALSVRRGHDYGSIGHHPLFTFCSEGAHDGQLSRPWGIVVDKLGRIVVTDRGNNRLQLFDQRGKFLSKFGREGTAPGEFKKPAGLAINQNNEIIVVDKDNHRVQVFSQDLKFMFLFGEEGVMSGQFNYPWDCAVNNVGFIAVSDTRNHRIQLFDPKGNFVRKLAFDLGEPRHRIHSASNKGQASTPRGLVFTQDGRLLVTDFNHHRLIVICPDNSEQPRPYGSLGAGTFNFNRPQGIDVDQDGTVLVCDGKNNRVQVFSPQLDYTGSFGCDDADRSVMRTPCDLCISPEGRIFVIDFDNNAIRVFAAK